MLGDVPMMSLLLAANPLQPVVDFYDSGIFRAGARLLVLLVVVLWFALALWTYKDARRRIQDPILIGVAVAAALVFPFVGPLIYLFLRPPEYLEDVRERELEIRAMERRLGTDDLCPYCRSHVEPSFLVCPSCTTRLKQACTGCGAPLEPGWRVCPYCAADAPGVPSGHDVAQPR
jgi:hypothetical protein